MYTCKYKHIIIQAWHARQVHHGLMFVCLFGTRPKGATCSSQESKVILGPMQPKRPRGPSHPGNPEGLEGTGDCCLDPDVCLCCLRSLLDVGQTT